MTRHPSTIRVGKIEKTTTTCIEQRNKVSPDVEITNYANSLRPLQKMPLLVGFRNHVQKY